MATRFSFRKRSKGSLASSGRTPSLRRNRPLLETLEDRRLMATFLVNNLTDSPVAGLTDLREAIALADAAPGSTITFDPGALGSSPQTITLAQGELSITAATTIAGPGAGAFSISGNNATRIFNIDDGTAASIAVTISGLTLTGGNAAGTSGGAISNAEDLTLTDSTVSGNLAQSGGGIFNTGGTLQLDHVTLDSNTARGAAGANSPYFTYYNLGSRLPSHSYGASNLGSPGQGARGGGLYNAGGAVTISNSTLTNNTAQGGAGGGGGSTNNGYNAGSGGAGGNGLGGGICSVGGLVELTNSTLSGNTAQGGKGGYGGYGGYGLLGGPGPKTSVGGDGGDAGAAAGGAVYATGRAAVTLTTTMLTGNLAQGGAGGPGSFGYSHGGQSGYGGEGQGGGLGVSGSSSVTLTDSTLSQDTARGGALPQDADPNLGGGDRGGESNSIGGRGLTGGDGQGGGLFVDSDAAVTLVRITLASDTAEGGDGGYGNGGADAGGNGGVGGDGQGGGIYLTGGGSATIADTTLSGNTVQGGDGGDGGPASGPGDGHLGQAGSSGAGGDGQGGAVFVDAVSVSLTQTTIADNTAQLGLPGLPGRGGYPGFQSPPGGAFGAGLFAGNATVVLTNSTIAYNDALLNALCNGCPHDVGVILGGNFYNGGRTTLNNTLIAGSLSGGDVYSPGSLVGHSSLIQDPSNQPLSDGVDGNIIGHDPLLGELTNKGGPTETILLQSGSPAIDAGDSSLAVDAQGNPLTADQRGAPFVRVFGASVDIGAFELQTIPARSLVVNTTADEVESLPGVLSLRDAIALADAAPGSTIQFDAGVFSTPQTITLALGELIISDAVTITGPGARLLTVSGNNTYRIFEINDGSPEAADVTISGLTLTRGNPNAGIGGAILNTEKLTLIDSTISGSTARMGGGIYNSGTLNLSGCTLSGNATAEQGTANPKYFYGGLITGGVGGGIFNYDGTATLANCTLAGNAAAYSEGLGGGFMNMGTATLTNCTLTGNTAISDLFLLYADSAAGGIFNFGGGSLTLNNTLIAGNLGGDLSGDYTGASDWIGGDPRLDPNGLRDNGGPTDTIALLPDSPLIDAGNSSLAVNVQSNPPSVFSDPSFETPSLQVGSYAYDPTGSAWTFSGSAGLASNGSAFNNPSAPQGNQVAFLQGSDSSISQVVDLAAGTYAIAFSAAQRPGNQQTFEVLVDGAVAATVTPSDSAFAPYSTDAFTVAAGSHTIQFVGLNPLGGDNTAFLDQIFQDQVTIPSPLTTDQRGAGFARVYGAAVDIGAYEFQPPNQPPTVASDQAALTVNEGSPATGTGTFDDPQGRGTVTLTASMGTITQDNAAGTWSWSDTPPDGPAGPTTVTITATDDGGLTATTSFTLTVNNVAPTAAITGAPASGHSPEGTTITLGSTVTDPSPVDTAAGFTDAWSVTKNGAAFASSTAASFSFTPDDNGTYVVSLTATDKDGGTSPAAQTTIAVDNVAPTAAITGPSDGVRGQARTFTLTASDPSPVDGAAGFTFAIAWGDGATQTVTGPSGTAVSHVYATSGTYGVQATATDKDGGTGAAATQADTITAVALEADPVDPTKTALFVGGTTGADTITIKPADAHGTLSVKIGTTSLGSFQPTGRLIVYGQAGDDTIKLQTSVINKVTVYVSTPAFLFGGDGNDTLDAAGSSANNVLEGGAGNDTLRAGSGRNLLVGGLGADVLHGGGGDDILIGGTTDFDNNLAALDAILAEWGRTDADYNTRINHLNGTLSGGLNGSTYLTTSTVHDDAAIDTLFGEGGLDWFFAKLSGSNKDTIKDQAAGEVITGL